MATVKIILRTSKINSFGEAPLCIRVIKNRKAQFIFLNYRLKPEHWDEKNRQVKKSHPNSKPLNHFIATKIKEAQDAALTLETNDKEVLSEHIKERIMGKSPMNFFEYAEKYLSGLEVSNKIGTLRKVKSILLKMGDYVGSNNLLFNHITVSWLKEYEQYLRKKQGNKTNTVSSNFRMLRVIINLAINEGVIEENLNPFKRFKLVTEKVKKDFLTDEELMMLQLAPLQKDSMKDLHLNMYVFSAYAGGLRISDLLLLKWKNFDGERIIMQTKKTSSVVSIKLPSKAMEIIFKYRKEDSLPEHFIFPVLKNNVDYSNPRYLFNCISSATAYANDDISYHLINKLFNLLISFVCHI